MPPAGRHCTRPPASPGVVLGRPPGDVDAVRVPTGADCEEAGLSEHPDVARLRGAYEAYGKGDLDHLTEVWTPDIRWHEPGRNQLSGEYTGTSAVFEMFGRTMELTEGSFRVDLRTVFADDTDGAAVVRFSGHRGERTLDVLAAHLFRFEGDRVAEFWEAHTDQAAVDEFFA